MPRAKYTRPPGPFRVVKRDSFRFSEAQWLKLTKLIPARLHELSVPSDYVEKAKTFRHRPRRTLKSVADMLVHETEGVIASMKTARPVVTSENKATPARVRAAIRRLRSALAPFIRNWVDGETANIIPPSLDSALERREKELVKLRISNTEHENLRYACENLGKITKACASTVGIEISDADALRYIDAALKFGGAKHPEFAKHRERLSALVFPAP